MREKDWTEVEAQLCIDTFDLLIAEAIRNNFRRFSVVSGVTDIIYYYNIKLEMNHDINGSSFINSADDLS